MRALHTAYGLDAAMTGATPTHSRDRGPCASPSAVLNRRCGARGREFLGCELAIMGGAMTWVSERNLVAAISNAGGFGVIASRLDAAGAARRRDRRRPRR